MREQLSNSADASRHSAFCFSALRLHTQDMSAYLDPNAPVFVPSRMAPPTEPSYYYPSVLAPPWPQPGFQFINLRRPHHRDLHGFPHMDMPAAQFSPGVRLGQHSQRIAEAPVFVPSAVAPHHLQHRARRTNTQPREILVFRNANDGSVVSGSRDRNIVEEEEEQPRRFPTSYYSYPPTPIIPAATTIASTVAEEQERAERMRINLLEARLHEIMRNVPTMSRRFPGRPGVPQLQECGICAEKTSDLVPVGLESGGEHYLQRPCDHMFCRGCMHQWIQCKVEGMERHIACPHPTCQYRMFPSDVIRIAPELAQRHKEIISMDFKARLQELEHEMDAESAAYMKEHVVPCPDCKVMMMKTEGCDTIQCLCGVSFCYLCRQMYVEIGEYSSLCGCEYTGRGLDLSTPYTCIQCTFINERAGHVCEACLTTRYPSPAEEQCDDEEDSENGFARMMSWGRPEIPGRRIRTMEVDYDVAALFDGELW